MLRMGEKRNYQKLDFTQDDETQIIDFVKQHSILFNPKDKDYKNKAKRDIVWNELGTLLDKSGFIIDFIT